VHCSSMDSLAWSHPLVMLGTGWRTRSPSVYVAMVAMTACVAVRRVRAWMGRRLLKRRVAPTPRGLTRSTLSVEERAGQSSSLRHRRIHQRGDVPTRFL
jgi:hypothetical protein